MGMLDAKKEHVNAHLLPNGKPRNLGILTSGGDAPGMNSAIRAVVRTALHEGFNAYAIHEGYSGLVKGGSYIKKQSWQDVRGYQSIGGTEIGTARCSEFKERPGRLTAAKNLVIHGIDALVICGGDGSLTGADIFRREWPGLLKELVEKKEISKEQADPLENLTIVGMVGSIDNDLSGTDVTIGAFSALGVICEMVDKVDDTARSHSRAFVVEVMGRHCGWLALSAGVALGADFIFIPEKPRAENWKEEMETIVAKHRKNGKRKTIVIIAEGANDQEGKPITAEMVKDLLADPEGMHLDTRITTLGHVQRGGTACAYDRTLATLQGVEAVRAVMDAKPDTPTCFIGVTENKICRRNLMEAVRDTKEVAMAIEARDFDKAMSLRDTEFADLYASYLITTSSTIDVTQHLPEDKRMRIGIIHVGAPAGGMNAATRAAVAYCQSRGHTPVAIYNGFAGFTRHADDKPLGAVRKFNWVEVDEWASKGGSEIGTNRELPKDSGFFNVAENITKHNLDALFVIGGFEAFHALSQLRKERENYPPFNIPMTLLPATISNNVPGTEYSLGSDTCLNVLDKYCDVIKQSASSSRRRVFIVETQGGRCGYIPVLSGLNVGAVAVYTPEEGISIDMLAADITHLRKAFSEDSGQARAGRLILVGEKASPVYDAKLIADIIKQEAHGRFESRDSMPGHVQQGLIPSSMDRCRAVRLAIKCIEQLEGFAGKTQKEIRNDPLSMSVIGFRGAKVTHTPMVDVENTETDWENRRPKDVFWADIEPIVDMLSGRPNVPRPERDLQGQLAKDIKRGIMRVI